MKKGWKQALFPIILGFFLLLACDEKPKNPISEYGDALIGSYKRGQQAGEEANLDAIKKTIQSYHAEHEKYPESLKDIEDLMRKPIDATKYNYDPQTGTITLKSNRP
jgi:hypothetical protein